MPIEAVLGAPACAVKMVQKSAATEAQRRYGTNLADLERRNGTNLHCRHRARAAKPTTRAAAPNRALHVGIFGMAGRFSCTVLMCVFRLPFAPKATPGQQGHLCSRRSKCTVKDLAIEHWP